MGRKSIARVDGNVISKKKKTQDLVVQLGVENFKDDVEKPLVTVRKGRAVGMSERPIHLYIEDMISKANNSHLPNGAERFAYKPTTNYNVVYIPVNRLKQIYQTDAAINPAKVKENRRKMREGIPLDPVEIGYNYDVHDGHHRWEAAMEEGHTHVPCKVVGTDPDKVKEAIEKYKEVWKAFYDTVMSRPEHPDLFLVLDISKRFLNTSKLVKKRVQVKGKNGKIFYRMQWVDPNENNPSFQHTGKNETTYAHHTQGISDLEKRQSNKFPVVHHDTKGLKNTTRNYVTDKHAYDEAHKKYHKGEELPPVKINHKGEILDNHHLVDLARKLGLSHVPVIVMGNTQEKKKLEDSLKDEVMTHGVDDQGKEALVPAATANGGNSASDHPDVATFKQFTSKKYSKQHIMNEAKRQGISWKETNESGELLSDHSAIAWMRAYQAIVNHINKGGKFEVGHDEKEVDKRMAQDGWDSVHKHFLKLLEKHGNKQALMEWAKRNGITWKEKADPSINWMYAATAIKKELAKGVMVGGVRTRQKEAMEKANLVITDQVRTMVRDLSQKYGKQSIMDRAMQLGIEYNIFDNKGNPLPANSPIIWMRASSAIQEYIAKGNTFNIGEDDYEQNGIAGKVGDYGDVKLHKLGRIAVDLGKRNSQNFELDAKDWAMKAFKADYGEGADHQSMYEKFMNGARNARILLHFDPTERLPNGVSLLDQMSSDGTLKNSWELGKVADPEAMSINERELFGYDFDDAAKNERPNYGVVDLFNRGLKSSPYGDAAFVLKQDVKKRATGVHTDSGNLDYETNGKLTRGMEDPHHLVVDRWRTRWKSPKNKDSKRIRMMNSVMNGVPNNDDGDYFEAHIHGGVDLRRDVDHILVPSHWRDDENHKDKHDRLTQLAKLVNVPIKYE